jgi:adenylate cyclase
MAADEGKRKIAAILAADVAGYSRLMADDDRATVRTLTEYREVFAAHIATHHGRIVDTAGDSVLATFESVIEAAEAAVEIQRELGQRNDTLPGHRRMYFRMGVNLGDIIERDDGTIYGDGVNVAARLEGLAEPGGVMVSESAHLHTEDKLGVGVAFIGEHEVKNIPRPVKAYRLMLDGAEPGPAPAKPARRTKLIAGAAIAAAVVAGLAVWGLTLRVEAPQMVMADGTPTDDPVLAMPLGPSVAVLPFDELSEDPPHPHLAEGISSQLVSNFTAFSDLFVFALDATRPLKEAQASPVTIRDALGADYVVQGSVQQSADAVRVTVDLINTESGALIWSDRYESELSANRLFDIQDEIAIQIAGALGSSGSGIMAEYMRLLRQQPPVKMSAYDCVLFELNYWSIRTPKLHAEVRDCLENAIEEEPDYARAWGSLAWNFSEEFMVAYNTRPDAEQRAVDAARRAVTLEPTAYNTNTLAQMLYWAGDYDQFRIHTKQALTLNSNDAEILMSAAFGYAGLGEIELADRLMQKALKLNPNPPAVWLWSLYHIEIGRRDFAAALTAAEKLYVEDFYFSHAALAAAYIGLGRQADAERAMQRTLELRPDWTVPVAREEMARFVPWPGLLDYYTNAMRQAGLPEAAPQPERPVIAVLPFENLSGDAEQDYFADGITEDIITRLAQLPDALVLGRNTTFQIKDSDASVGDFAMEIGADYVLEGSVRRNDDALRISAQLLDVDEDAHLWAETFDRSLDVADLFAVQDEITERVAALVGGAYGVVTRTELAQLGRKAPQYLSSYECTLRYWQFFLILSPENHLLARECLEKVVEAEPEYADALAMLADTHIVEVAFSFNRRDGVTLEDGLRLAERAAHLEPDNLFVRSRLMAQHLYNHNRDRALRLAEEMLELAPNNVDFLWAIGEVFDLTGECERSFEIWQRTIELNPNAPKMMHWRPARCHMAHGNWAEGLRWIDASNSEWHYWTHAYRAAAQCQLGEIERGQEALQQALEMKPDFAEVLWPESEFWNQGGDTRAMEDNWVAGLETCGFELPPRPEPLQ